MQALLYHPRMQFRISYGIAFGIIGVLIIFTTLALWLGAFRPESRKLTATPRAVITEVRGTVKLTRGGSSGDVRSGDEVLADDVLTTGEASVVTMTFFGSARAAIDANSSVRIDEAFIDSAKPRRQNIRLALLSGRVWSRVLALLDAESSYGVEYNGVVSGVRGTAFAITARGTSAVIDVFGGTIGVSGKTSGRISRGFSATIDIARPPATVDEALVSTPDATINDSWVQEQLDDDALFSHEVIDMRSALGVEDAITEYTAVQKEADSGVLRNPGVEDSDYDRLTVQSASQKYVLSADAPVQLQAIAHFLRPNGEQTRDVTILADWYVSHPERAAVKNGLVTLAPEAAGGVGDGTVQIVVRWHDGTHAHSAAVTLLLSR